MCIIKKTKSVFSPIKGCSRCFCRGLCFRCGTAWPGEHSGSIVGVV